MPSTGDKSMNRRMWLKSFLLSLIFRPSLSAQSRAYVKFGAGGETVGLYNLMKRGASCGFWQVSEGTVAGVSVEKGKTEAEYRFAMNGRVGVRVFEFTLGPDDISESDIRDLLTKKRGVKVRACRNGRQWLAEEITRL